MIATFEDLYWYMPTKFAQIEIIAPTSWPNCYISSQLAFACSKLTIKTTERCKICSKLTIKTPMTSLWCFYC